MQIVGAYLQNVSCLFQLRIVQIVLGMFAVVGLKLNPSDKNVNDSVICSK